MSSHPPVPIERPLPRAGVGLLWQVFLKRRARDPDQPAQVPATVFTCAAPLPQQLARYQDLLGFAPGSLPLTWYYLPIQRAHLATMLAPAFPFRLPGMVHVEQALAEHLEPEPGSPLRFLTTVRIEAPSASGARFVLLETSVWQGERRVLDCASKYLAMAGRRSGAGRPRRQEAPAGPELGGWRLGRGEGRAYARVSGDWNPIHLSGWTARLFGLEAPIIHGMHSVAKALALLEARQGRRVRQLSVRFRAPVPLGSMVVMLGAPGSAAFALVCDGRLAVEGSVDHGFPQ